MLATANQLPPQYWLADSGATNHMTSDAQMLSNISPMSTSDSVQVGNGAQLPVTHFGNTKLGSLILKNVLLIPELAAHLLSIYQLCKQNNCSVWFDEFMCIIQDKVLGKILFKGLSKHGLYPIPFDLPLLQASSSSGSSNAPVAVQNKAFFGKSVKHSLWHQRFGHPSNEIVTAMLNKSGISSLHSSESSICEPCLLGKFHKLPFSKSVSRSQKPFELIHSDVWGPSPHSSIDGFRYFVLFIDDCTRFTWIFPMKNKSEVFHYFQYLCALIQNQFSTSVKILRSDGGGEYMSSKFKEFLSLKGIIHQVSCPYTPEQNGISERKNRHLRETAVTLLQSASLPPLFWYHACAIATYLINRMPTPVLNMCSPFECLYRQLSPVDMLRVFGCACYPLMTPYRANKLQPKTMRCIFVGFANGYKGYICYNPISHKFIISRHVFFDESFFPYASLSTPAASTTSPTGSVRPPTHRAYS
jgi:transposase InsO family protein